MLDASDVKESIDSRLYCVKKKIISRVDVRVP